VFIAEIDAQWRRAGYPIDTNPGALVTIFNIGFGKSVPNPFPSDGGSQIETGGKTYTYGELGAAFYASTELASVFPKAQ
jgi:hypothetical protein